MTYTIFRLKKLHCRLRKVHTRLGRIRHPWGSNWFGTTKRKGGKGFLSKCSDVLKRQMMLESVKNAANLKFWLKEEVSEASRESLLILRQELFSMTKPRLTCIPKIRLLPTLYALSQKFPLKNQLQSRYVRVANRHDFNSQGPGIGSYTKLTKRN